MTDICGRCARELHGLAETEMCVMCEGPLCVPCWEETGCCPHPGADDWQRRMKAATTPAERAALFAELGPIGAPKTKRPIH